MTTCRECASEISETEAFCPYCGIKIERAVEAQPLEDAVVVDDSLESTIMMSPADALRLQAEAEDAARTPPSSPFESPSVAGRTAPTLEDIPTPSLLSSGSARRTEPDISILSDATPTKESPVFDESIFGDTSAPDQPPVFEPVAEPVESDTPVQMESFPPKEPTFDLAPLPEPVTDPAVAEPDAEDNVPDVPPSASSAVEEPISISK